MNDTYPSPSTDETHHQCVKGHPVYTNRFVKVGKFHTPGLAPVEDSSGAYHITPDGEPAYLQRYRKAWGFYCDRAAVLDSNGWLHIGPSGLPAYEARFAWVGNFQEELCPVRGVDGLYGHIDIEGNFIGLAGWKYAGDYRDGIAVVQSDRGLSSHINREGMLIHHQWYQDLDVFHKGFARAKDDHGWTHTNLNGCPIYGRRFCMVEPYYNGQARVANFDGSLEIIDEKGSTLHVLRPPKTSALHRLSGLLVSLWKSEVLFGAFECGIFDLLPCNQERLSEGQLLLLSALHEMELVQVADCIWSPTEVGKLMKKGQDGATITQYWAQIGRKPWDQVVDATGSPSWMPGDHFLEISTDSEKVRLTQSALAVYARHDYRNIAPLIVPGHHAHFLDAGGGLGDMLSIILEANPISEGTVMDRCEVVNMARTMRPPNPRMRFAEGDLFREWPVKADGILLARVLHDWDDATCEVILRNAKTALTPGGLIYVIEMIKPENPPTAGLLSLHLRLVSGGRERKASEFTALFTRVGLILLEIKDSNSFWKVMIVTVPRGEVTNS